MKNSIVMIAFAIATLTFVSCGKKGNSTTVTEQTAGDKHQLAYACPMDCEKGKTYDKPGKCPVCEMDLKEVKTENHEGHQH